MTDDKPAGSADSKRVIYDALVRYRTDLDALPAEPAASGHVHDPFLADRCGGCAALAKAASGDVRVVNAMTEPRTAAGRALLRDFPARPRGPYFDVADGILAIEAEARAAGAEEALDGYRALLGLEIPGERMSRNHLDAALARVEEHIGRKEKR